ncbi:hypothetical protein BGX20_003169 [Mortierella sp. AD010]|nr:hypothetical protein BGX20_003169 [Mortierella sp. AD010]
MNSSKEKAISSAYIATNNIIGAGAEGAAIDAANYWTQSRLAESRKAQTSEETPSNVDWPEYERRMASLDREFFWQLRSGRYVEDVLIEAARSTQMQRNVHDLLIDTSDKITRDLFTQEEWNEILEQNRIQLTKPRASIVKYLKTFNVNNVEDIFTTVSKALPTSGEFNAQKHWEFVWVRMAIESWLGIYTQCPPPLASPQTEAFYLNQCYGMIASLVRDVPYMTTILGEKTLPESASRRNDARGSEYDKSNHRRNLGDRVDLIFSVQQTPPYSIGVAEASPTYQDDYETKFMKDKKKITRELHDLLRCRLDDIPLSTRASEFAIVGFMISASVPAQFPKNLKILHHLLSMKGLLIHSKSILDDIVDGEIFSSGVDSESESYSSSALPLRAQPSDQVKRAHLPKQQDSPDRKVKRKLQKPLIPRKAMKLHTAPSRDDFAYVPPTGTLRSSSKTADSAMSSIRYNYNSTQVAPVQTLRKQGQMDGEVNLVSNLKYSKSTEDTEHQHKKPMKLDIDEVAHSDSESDSDGYRKYEGEEEEEEVEKAEMVEVVRKRGDMRDLPLANPSALPNQNYNRNYNHNSPKKLAPGGSRKL